MIKHLLFDFSRVLLFPIDEKYRGSLNELHKQLSIESDYKVLDHFRLNDILLYFVDNLKTVKASVFTTETIQESEELAPFLIPTFQKIYSSQYIGLTKAEPGAYTYIAKDLGLEPNEIFFIDDTKENIDAAQKAGLSTHQYTNISALLQELSKAKIN